MKLHCERESLLAECQLVATAVATRDIKPILRNIKAVAVGDKCTLMATDLEIGIRLDLRSPKVQSPGEAILPATRFLSILRESTDEHLTIDANGDKCMVTGA